MSTNERIRGSRLQKIRVEHFRKHPLCVRCKAQGLVRAATQLDHIVALCNGGQDVPENRQGLCAECHEQKTREDLGLSDKPRIGLDGWPEGGGVSRGFSANPLETALGIVLSRNVQA